MTILTMRDLGAPYQYVVSEKTVDEAQRLLLWSPEMQSATSVFLSDLAQGWGSILRLEGLGKEVWAGIEPTEYVDELRDEWDRD